MEGLLAGQSCTTTNDYSFLLVMSVLIATTCHEQLKNLNLLHGEDSRLLAIGIIMSMGIALNVVKKVIRSVTRDDFTSSTLSRIDLGLLALT